MREPNSIYILNKHLVRVNEAWENHIITPPLLTSLAATIQTLPSDTLLSIEIGISPEGTFLSSSQDNPRFIETIAAYPQNLYVGPNSVLLPTGQPLISIDHGEPKPTLNIPLTAIRRIQRVPIHP